MLKRLLPLVVFLSLPWQLKADDLTNELFQRTFLIELVQGSELSATANSLGATSYESAYGANIRMDKWYSTQWTDARISFVTQVDRNFGLIWGFSTGERGAKYQIDPSLKIGFSFVKPIGKTAGFSLTATTIFGGRLREKSCTADYGEIGGVQQVNCRLAATTLTPSDTLNYLVDQRPKNRELLQLRYTFNF